MKGLRGYIIGFGLSLALTFGSYSIIQLHLNTDHQSPSHQAVFVSLSILAITQLAVQVWFFLHLGEEKRPRWNLMAFLFMLLVVTLLVGGTLWIMKNLNYHGMSPEETNQQIIEDEGFGSGGSKRQDNKEDHAHDH